jgi:hypothetical protein
MKLLDVVFSDSFLWFVSVCVCVCVYILGLNFTTRHLKKLKLYKLFLGVLHIESNETIF